MQIRAIAAAAALGCLLFSGIAEAQWNPSGGCPIASAASRGCVQVDGTTITVSNGIISAVAGGVTAISNGDGTLTISPTTGAAVASLALGHANNWSGQQTFVAPVLGSATATSLGIGETAPSSGNLNISGNYQIGGTQIATTNLKDTVAPASWTPADASGASLSLTVNAASYTQIGKFLFANFRVVYPTTASSSVAAISGLPVNSASAGFNLVGGVCYTSASVTGGPLPFINSNAATVNQFLIESTGLAMTNANLSTDILMCELAYITQ